VNLKDDLFPSVPDEPLYLLERRGTERNGTERRSLWEERAAPGSIPSVVLRTTAAAPGRPLRIYQGCVRMSAGFPPPAPTPTQGEGDRLRVTIKVLAILVGVLAGLSGALICYLTVRHLGAAPLVATPSAGGAFLAVASFVYFVEEKLNLL
jgi:hypothetical protein